MAITELPRGAAAVALDGVTKIYGRGEGAVPEVIFADEPTGALDTRSARDLLAMLRAATDRDRRTVVIVTHDPVAVGIAVTLISLAGAGSDPNGGPLVIPWGQAARPRRRHRARPDRHPR